VSGTVERFVLAVTVPRHERRETVPWPARAGARAGV
jgi:hypothetical protein